MNKDLKRFYFDFIEDVKKIYEAEGQALAEADFTLLWDKLTEKLVYLKNMAISTHRNMLLDFIKHLLEYNPSWRSLVLETVAYRKDWLPVMDSLQAVIELNFSESSIHEVVISNEQDVICASLTKILNTLIDPFLFKEWTTCAGRTLVHLNQTDKFGSYRDACLLLYGEKVDSKFTPFDNQEEVRDQFFQNACQFEEGRVLVLRILEANVVRGIKQSGLWEDDQHFFFESPLRALIEHGSQYFKIFQDCFLSCSSEHIVGVSPIVTRAYELWHKTEVAIPLYALITNRLVGRYYISAWENKAFQALIQDKSKQEDWFKALAVEYIADYGLEFKNNEISLFKSQAEAVKDIGPLIAHATYLVVSDFDLHKDSFSQWNSKNDIPHEHKDTYTFLFSKVLFWISSYIGKPNLYPLKYTPYSYFFLDDPILEDSIESNMSDLTQPFYKSEGVFDSIFVEKMGLKYLVIAREDCLEVYDWDKQRICKRIELTDTESRCKLYPCSDSFGTKDFGKRNWDLICQQGQHIMGISLSKDKLVFEYSHNTELVAVSKDGKSLALKLINDISFFRFHDRSYSAAYNSLVVFNLESFTFREIIGKNSKSEVIQAEFISNNDQLLILWDKTQGGNNRYLQKIDSIGQGTGAYYFSDDLNSSFDHIFLSEDGRLSSFGDNSLIFDSESIQPLLFLNFPSGDYCSETRLTEWLFTKDNKYAIVKGDRDILIFSLDTGDCIQHLMESDSQLSYGKAAFSIEGDELLVIKKTWHNHKRHTYDYALYLWDWASLIGQTHIIKQLPFSLSDKLRFEDLPTEKRFPKKELPLSLPNRVYPRVAGRVGPSPYGANLVAIVEKANTLIGEIGLQFGFEFVYVANDKSSSPKMLHVSVDHPATIDPVTGKSFTNSQWSVTLKDGEFSVSSWIIEKEHELVFGSYVFKILDGDTNEVLCTQTFYIDRPKTATVF